MLKKLRKLVRQRRRAARREQTKREIGAMKSSSVEEAHAICDAVLETLGEVLSAEERSAIETIEKSRQKLQASSDQINVVDYGAGTFEDSRSEEEMAEGVHTRVRVSDVASWSKERFWALLLFKLVRSLGSKRAVELGTCVGISAAYQATAQRLNGGGRLMSLEGSPEIAALAQGTLQESGLDQASVVVGSFLETYESSMAEMSPVDYLFIDGHHDRDATIRYYREAIPHLAEHGVIVFDDISWNEGMKEAWQTIRRDPYLCLSVDLGPVGIGVYSAEEAEGERFDFPL